jgi:hypothetical protein
MRSQHILMISSLEEVCKMAIPIPAIQTSWRDQWRLNLHIASGEPGSMDGKETDYSPGRTSKV